MSNLVQISLFKSASDNVPQAAILTLEEAAQLLTTHSRRTTKDGPLWSPTIYHNGSTRNSAGVQSITALVYDIDHDVDYAAIRQQVGGYECVVHSTFSSTPEAPRLRVVLFLARPVSAIEYPEVRARAAYLLHLKADPATKDASRIYYLPSCPPGALTIAVHCAGQLLAPDTLPPVPGQAPLTAGFRPPAAPVGGTIPHGAQHHTLLSIGGSMRARGLDVDEIEAALQVVNERRCEIPGPRANIRKIAESVCKYPAGEMAPPTIMLGGKQDAEDQPELKQGRYTLHSAAEVFEELPPTEWVVGELLSRRSVGALVGAPGSKKTYTALDMAVCVAMGKPWLGRSVIQGNVLLIDEESGNNRLRRRLNDVMRAHCAGPDTPIFWTSLEMFNLRKTTEVAEVEGLLLETAPVLVIVDALADIMPGGDENSVADTHPVLQSFRQMADRYECAIFIIHHANKVGGYRGSSAILGALDLMLMVESAKDSIEIKYTTEKARDTEPQVFGAAIRFNAIDGNVMLTDERPEKPPERKRSLSEQYVLKYLEAHNRRAWIVDIKAAPDCCTPMAAERATYRLANEGLLRRCDDGKAGEKAMYEMVWLPLKPLTNL